MPKIKNENIVRDYIIIDGERVGFDLTLYNKSKSISIPLDNFISFIVEEEISTPFQKGVIKLKNDNNRFDLLSVPNTNNKGDFTLAETGENLLILNLDFQSTVKTYILFIIEESTETQNNIKVKNFFVEDSSLYTLRNNKTVFSTSSLLKGDTTQLSDKDRQINVSDAIKELIIDSLTVNLVNEDKWYISNSKTNHTTNFNDSRLDGLSYLLDKSVDQNDNTLLLLKRDNQFGLYSLQEMYNNYMNLNNVDNFGGNFTIIGEEYIRENTNTVISYKVNDYNLYNENSIDTIENIINHKVINYDFKNKEFNIFSEDNSVESLTKNIRENFLNKKTDIVREESPSVKNNKIFRSMYSTTSDLNTARFEGRNNLLKNLMNLSTMLSMKTDGVYYINVGNFININYETNYQNKTSKKLNGGWFVTALKHTLTQNSFGSEIVCTKFHELK